MIPTINTFGDALDYYADCLRAKDRFSAWTQGKVGRVRAEFGHLSLSDVPDYLEEWRGNFVGTPYRGKMRLPASMNNPTNTIKATFNRLVKAGIVAENPITNSRFPKYRENKRNRYLSSVERAKIFAAIEQYRPCIMPIVRYMITVPCRLRELTTAKREAYDDDTKTIFIPKSKSRIPIYKPVPDDMLDYFRAIPQACPWLFYWVDDGGRYHPLKSIQTWWRECRVDAEVADIRIHDLRHIAATDLLIAGNPVWMIMDIAGWRTDMFSTYWHKNSLLSAQKIVFGK